MTCGEELMLLVSLHLQSIFRMGRILVAQRGQLFGDGTLPLSATRFFDAKPITPIVSTV
jgi:hypothetical protein